MGEVTEVRPIMEVGMTITIVVVMVTIEITVILIHVPIRVGIMTVTITDEVVGADEDEVGDVAVVAMMEEAGVVDVIRTMVTVTMTATIAIAKKINSPTIWSISLQKMTLYPQEPCSPEISNSILPTRK